MLIQKLSISLLVGLLCSTTLQASVHDVMDQPSTTDGHSIVLVAQTNTKKRRDHRQDDRGRSDNRDDRRDCREDDGLGKDKRDCKQAARKGEKPKEPKSTGQNG